MRKFFIMIHALVHYTNRVIMIHALVHYTNREASYNML